MKQNKEILFNKKLSFIQMKFKSIINIIFCCFLIFITSCKGQKIDDIITELPITIDTVTNFQLVDDLSTYPSYNFYNKKFEAYITINYKGKTKDEKTYWDVNNPTGYFSLYKNINEPQLLNKEIKESLFNRGLNNYNITAIVTYKKDIKEYYSDDNVVFKPNANYYLYSFKDNSWKFEESKKIDY